MLRKLIILSLFLFSVPAVYACSCGAVPAVLDEFEWAEDVFTARVIKKIRPRPGESSYIGMTGITSVVEKVYKGARKPGDVVSFKQGNGVSCAEEFEKDIVGKTLLVYDTVETDKPEVLGGCGRTTYAEYAREDFLYLDNMDRVRGKTRVSGQFGWQDWDRGGALDPAFEDAKITLTGEAGRFETKVDEYGIYEIYDVPPGEYRLTYSRTPGFEINPYATYDDEVYFEIYKKWPPESLPVTVKAGRHFHLDLEMMHYNPFRIKVLGPDGNPLNWVGVDAWRKPETTRWSWGSRTTDDGVARLWDISPRHYYLRINGDGKITANEPFPVLYYPGTTDPRKAQKVEIPRGGTKELFVFKVPYVFATNTVLGTLTYADGSPAANMKVNFVPLKSRAGFDDTSSGSTDKDGNFNMPVFAGIKGRLVVKDNIYRSDFTACPDTFKDLQKKFGGENNSFPVKIGTEEMIVSKNIENIRLTLPFSGCPQGR